MVQASIGVEIGVLDAANDPRFSQIEREMVEIYVPLPRGTCLYPPRLRLDEHLRQHGRQWWVSIEDYQGL